MTVESIADFYSETEVGQEIRGRGLKQGLARTLTALLRVRFGNHPQIPAIAEHFAQASDAEASVRTITEAKTLDDLLAGLSFTS